MLRRHIEIETAADLYVRPGDYLRIEQTGEYVRIVNARTTRLTVARVGRWHFRWMRVLALARNTWSRVRRAPDREYVGEMWADD